MIALQSMKTPFPQESAQLNARFTVKKNPLARKKFWWWIASSGLPYQNDAIRFQENVQNDSCLSRLLLMTKCFVLREYEKSLHIISLVTKHFVMRECENIRSGYLCVLTAVFSQMMTIYCHNAQCARSKGFPLV